MITKTMKAFPLVVLTRAKEQNVSAAPSAPTDELLRKDRDLNVTLIFTIQEYRWITSACKGHFRRSSFFDDTNKDDGNSGTETAQ